MATVLYGVNVVSGGSADGGMSFPGGGTPNAITTAQLALISAGGTNFNNLSAGMATLVADAASPTSAHVSAANSAYTALVADMATVTSGGSTTPYDVTVMVNIANAGTVDKVRRAMRVIRQLLSGDSRFTE